MRRREDVCRIEGTRLARGAALAGLAVLTACQQTPHASLAAPLEPARTDLEGAAHGFPEMRSLDGASLAQGDFTQWFEDGRLHIRIRYDFGGEHWIEERVVVQQEPQLIQDLWSWREVRGERVERAFEVDFLAGTASAETSRDGESKHWSEHVELEPGRAFAGSCFTLAIKGLRERLVAGETVTVQTVGFTPKPKLVAVEIRHAGLDRVPMSGRTLEGDHFVVHAKLPPIVRVFVEAPDTHLWLVHPEPAAFLRWEGPLAEPSDPIVRVDLLPGEPSRAAIPAGE